MKIYSQQIAIRELTGTVPIFDQCSSCAHCVEERRTVRESGGDGVLRLRCLRDGHQLAESACPSFRDSGGFKTAVIGGGITIRTYRCGPPMLEQCVSCRHGVARKERIGGYPMDTSGEWYEFIRRVSCVLGLNVWKDGRCSFESRKESDASP